MDNCNPKLWLCGVPCNITSQLVLDFCKDYPVSFACDEQFMANLFGVKAPPHGEGLLLTMVFFFVQRIAEPAHIDAGAKKVVISMLLQATTLRQSFTA